MADVTSEPFARYVPDRVLKKEGRACRQAQERPRDGELGQKLRNTSPRHDVVPVPGEKIYKE